MDRYATHPFRQGFTLIEIAVVMVIIGLLVGGILMGESMLKGERVRAIVPNAMGYIAAVQEFQKKYAYLPGDFPSAVKVWGKADSDTTLTTNCASPNDDVASPAATCNGDGSGAIDSNYERYRAWQQLGLSGLITGNYRGVGSGAGTVTVGGVTTITVGTAAAGVNVPTDANIGSLYLLATSVSCTYCTSNGSQYDGNYTGAMFYGSAASIDGSGPIIPADEMQSLDRKFDDGMPATGTIRTWTNAINSGCTNSASVTATYSVSNGSGKACSIIFMPDFRASKTGV